MAEPRPAPENTISGSLGGTLSINIDKASVPDITFIGMAEPGSLLTEAVWKIFIIDKTTAVIRVRFANGNSNFSNIWDDRIILSYS